MSDEIIEEYRIPIRHERGTYALGEVSVPEDYDGEVMTVKLESPGIVTNSMNEISLYDFKDDLRDVIEINYRHPMKYFGTEMPDNLESVFVKCSDGSKYPIWLEYMKDRSFWSLEYNVIKDMQALVVKCAAELLKSLENAKQPLNPLQLMYYHDQTHVDIVITDVLEEKSYSVADNGLMTWISCVVLSVPEWYEPAALKYIISGVHNRLDYEIPKHFETTDIYELNPPSSYD